MRSVIGFTVAVRRRARFAAALVIMTTTPWSADAAEAINVTLDQARVTKAPERTATIVVGNPLIADVSIQAGGAMVVTGKGYGVTNLIMLDRGGQVLAELLVTVRTPANSVVVNRGPAKPGEPATRESYSCAPYCEPRITLGDRSTLYPERYFDGILKETLDRNGAAQQGEAVGGAGGAAAR
jgi:Pilus formation protein N terminal region